jgi:hypothetical protein
MKRFFKIIFFSGLIVWLTACGGGGSSSSEPTTQLPAPFPPGKFGEIIVNSDFSIPKEALFLDIRDTTERNGGYAAGTIAGAVFEFRH